MSKTKILNSGQQIAYDVAMSGENMWILGPPGTGKSFSIANISKAFIDIGKQLAITAMTGAAASLLTNGITVHRFTRTGTESLKMHLQDFPKNADVLSESNRNKLKSVDALIIDEAGMLSTDAELHLDHYFRKLRGVKNKKFGGMQVILMGDIAQLPPTATTAGPGEMRDELIEMESVFNYPDSSVYKVCVLYEFMRQADDVALQQICLAFIDPNPDLRKKALRLLNKLATCEDDLNFVDTINKASEIGSIIITPTNSQVDRYLKTEEALLKQDNNPVKISEPYKLYKIENLSAKQIEACGGVRGVLREDKEIVERRTFLFKLQLYPGQQVKITRNGQYSTIQYYNGNLCQFLEYNAEEEYCLVKRNSDNVKIRIQRCDHKTEHAKEVGEIGYDAFPIVPAIATNVHKVQGQTLNKIIVDPTNLRCFGFNIPNMLYVMTSRVKRCSDIVLTEHIPENIMGTRDINKYLTDLWNVDFMQLYPRADPKMIESLLVDNNLSLA